jgi:hypothetical protein
MQRWGKFVSVLALALVLGGLVWWQQHSASVAALPESETGGIGTVRSDYEPLYEMLIGSTSLYASLALTDSERTRGLSNTTMLPDDVAKVFVFPREDLWSFWMKEMLYPIDIIWVNSSSTVVHIETAVSPDTYPESFTPSAPARYVIEVVAGWADNHGVSVGTKVVLPEVDNI